MDIVNVSRSVSALNIKNAVGTSMKLFVTNAGNTTVGTTGSLTVTNSERFVPDTLEAALNFYGGNVAGNNYQNYIHSKNT